MGKVYRHLYPQVHDWENLLLAWRKARKGKRGYPPAAISLDDMTASVRGWVNHVRYADTLGLRRALFRRHLLYPKRPLGFGKP